MKITIVETGRPPDALRPDWPDYPEMFRDLIGQADDGFTYETMAVIDGVDLPDPASLEAILITGSPAGVYDDAPWIAPLLDFIRWAAAEKTPQVGICFGHQAMAQALGGQVVKSPKGWGIGRHHYELVTHAPWMDPASPDGFALAVSHQDQVVTPPPGAQTLARSAFTPFAALSYAQGPAMSFQGHPEFTPGFASALYEIRRANPLSDEAVEGAIASLEAGHDNNMLSHWIAHFFRQAVSETPRQT
jgi:GMP synthase-like glutamine amidotransferase